MTSQPDSGPVQISDDRLRAVVELNLSSARQFSGRHEYDGMVQDLSPSGVKAGLDALDASQSPPQPDPHDEAQLEAAITAARVRLGDLELYRISPLGHILNLDLSCYDREYAPPEHLRTARDAHIRQWPDAIDAAIESLDQTPSPVAEAALPMARGLGTAVGVGDEAARTALERFVEHLEEAVEHGDPSGALGARPFQRLLESSEASSIDLTELARRADDEHERLHQILEESCRRIDSGATTEATIERLRRTHPSTESLLPTARALVAEALEWTAGQGLVPYLDGECEVALTPEAQRIAAAGMFGAAPAEVDTPSRFYVTPPEPSWALEDQDSWLASYFNEATLPVIAVHEVAPGHFAHWRAWRRTTGEVRRTLASEGFEEGWAHYAEHVALEEGFRGGNPTFAAGVALDGLRRVARLRCAIGLHAGEMTLDDASDLFGRDAYVVGPGAAAEARRGLLNPTYGCYTWGRLAVLDLREKARQRWGDQFSLLRFHSAMLALGSPPLGLLDTALERG